MDGGKHHYSVDGLGLHSRAVDASGPGIQSQMGIQVRLVGRLEILGPDGTILLPKTRKARATLAILADAAPQPVPRSRLVSLLWSRRDREQAFGSLRQTVQELLRLFEELPLTPLKVSRTDLQLVPDLVRVDTASIASAAPGDPAVLDLLCGTLLEDLENVDPAFDTWLRALRVRFARTARGVGETLLSLEQEPAGIIALGDKLLQFDRMHEPFWRAVIAAHAQLGDMSQALKVFKRCEATLAESATEPSAETLALVVQIRAARRPPAGSPTSAVPATRLRAKLGVQPLVGLGETGPELAFAVSEAIITALAGFRSVSLIPVASTLPDQFDPTASTFEWDLDWVLEGSIQRGGGRVRVTLRLLDRRRGGEVAWVKRIESDLDDLLQLQDDIAGEVAAQLDTQMAFLEAQHTTQRGAPDAYGLLMPAIPSIYQLDQQRYLAAGKTLADATEMAPEFAAAHAWWAFWHVFLVGQGWADDAQGAMARAGELAQRAVMLDPLDARALALAGHVHGFLHRGHARGAVLLDRALALNPYLPIAWVSSGLNRCYAGDHDEAIRRINRGRQLSPADPHGFFFDAALMMPILLSRNFSEVVTIGERVGGLNPRLTTALKIRLSALGHLGRMDEVAPLRELLGVIEPNFSRHNALARSPMRREADSNLYVEGLRLAKIG